MTPDAVSRPNALPPERTTAWICLTVLTGSSRSVSRVPGAAPRTSTPATAPSSVIMTVQPVGLRESVKWPTLIPATSVIAELPSDRSGFDFINHEPLSRKRPQEAEVIPPRKISRRVNGDKLLGSFGPCQLTGDLFVHGSTTPLPTALLEFPIDDDHRNSRVVFGISEHLFAIITVILRVPLIELDSLIVVPIFSFRTVRAAGFGVNDDVCHRIIVARSGYILNPVHLCIPSAGGSVCYCPIVRAHALSIPRCG